MRKHLLWLLCVALPVSAQDWLALTLTRAASFTRPSTCNVWSAPRRICGK